MQILLILTILFYPDLKEGRIEIDKIFEINNPSDMTLIIENINGDVEVESSTDNKVYLSLVIEINARSESQLSQAKNELELGEYKEGDSLLVFHTKAPFVKRNKWGNGWGYDMRDQPSYDFKYQYKLKVPKQINLKASTINKGDVIVKNVKGNVQACNVNGEVEIHNAVSVSRASTVNGDVTISFLESPRESIDFNTVNGDFNFELPADFSAKVYFDSMHGDIYTAFDYRHTKLKIEKSEKHGKYHVGKRSGVEIGSGGPELSFKSINGNVYLNKSSR